MVKFEFSCSNEKMFGRGPTGDVGLHLSLRAVAVSAPLDCVDCTIYFLKKVANGYKQGLIGDVIQLPERALLKSDKVLRIGWAAQRLTLEDFGWIPVPIMTTERFHRAFDDVLDALEYGLDLCPKSDARSLLAWMKAIREEDRGSDADLRALLAREWKEQQAIWNAQDPWERLEVDWELYHPDARQHLDAPEDWDSGNDFSPHGNDTGFDIFANWERYGDLTCVGAFNRLMGKTILKFPPKPRPKWLPRNFWWLPYLQTSLAVAFGHVKMSGVCPPAIAVEALEAIEAEVGEIDPERASENGLEWRQCLQRYQEILKRFVV